MYLSAGFYTGISSTHNVSCMEVRLSLTHTYTHNFNIKYFKNDIKVKVQSLNK